MPQELPGFYFDPEKNRYFPLKGRKTPGSTFAPKLSPSARNDVTSGAAGNRRRTALVGRVPSLLRSRELCGNQMTGRGGRRKFEDEIRKLRASLPQAWLYDMDRSGDTALQKVNFDVMTIEGRVSSDGLLLGSTIGLLTLCDVGGVGSCLDNGLICEPHLVWPADVKGDEGIRPTRSRSPPHLHKPTMALAHLSSDITCVKLAGTRYPSAGSSDPPSRHALVTTLGSDRCGATVNVLDLAEPFSFLPTSESLGSRMHAIRSLKCTIWTADCSANARRAVIGTSSGAAVVNLEDGVMSWICRSSSDILAVQLDQSGNMVLCGHRNGTILTIDIRERAAPSTRHIVHQVPFPSADAVVRNDSRSRTRWFKVTGRVCPAYTANMSKSVVSLVSLRTYDQYFLASSMDGSIGLYDLRHAKKGPLQTYEGNVNSHTRIQLGTDPAEAFVLSGGEDCYLRLWDIRSGKLLFEDKFSEEIPSVLCTEIDDISRSGSHGNSEWGSWLGTRKGLFHVHF